MEHCEKKGLGGTSAAASAENRGVATALWDLEHVELQGDEDWMELLSFFKLEKGNLPAFRDAKSALPCCRRARSMYSVMTAKL